MLLALRVGKLLILKYTEEQIIPFRIFFLRKNYILMYCLLKLKLTLLTYSKVLFFLIFKNVTEFHRFKSCFFLIKNTFKKKEKRKKLAIFTVFPEVGSSRRKNK